MMVFRGRIAAVSYLNTVPLIYGIERAQALHAALLLSPPAGCADAFDSHKADIALVPVGALSQITDYSIITSFCIGASRAVRTVVLITDEPLENIRRIFLDPHSRTSALLVQVLCRHHWGISPRFEPLTDYEMVDSPAPGDAYMLIGDKVFDYEARFAFVHDLAGEWISMTGLPFVFAVWVARQKVPPSVVADLEAALEYGTGHIREAIDHYGHSGKPYAFDYLTHNIDYRFDAPKRQALTLFQNLLPK